MRILVVKTSSMGDLVHALPALTEAADKYPDAVFDWVAEEGFAAIPALHRRVDRVITVAVRRWRKSVADARTRVEIRHAISELSQFRYNHVIDAQGLVKSGAISRFAKGTKCGMDFASCREGLASVFYRQRIHVPRQQHAIERVRQLFASVFGYEVDSDRLDYGIDSGRDSGSGSNAPYLVFLHASSAERKLWPAADWVQLGRMAADLGYSVQLPWGNPVERERARQLAGSADNFHVLPRMGLSELVPVLASAAGIVGVDTGLSHLGAALSVPGVTLYTATDPGLTGARGRYQQCLVRPGVAPVGGECGAPGVGLRVMRPERLEPGVVMNSLLKQMSAVQRPA